MALTAAHSNPNAPAISRTAAERRLSARMLNNIVQGLIWSDGRGLQETWVQDASILEVRVLKHEGISSFSRTVGEDGTTNNNYFNENVAEQPAHQTALLKLNEVYDRVQQIPQLMEDVISVNILNVHAQRIEERVRQLINGYTLAKKAAAALQYAVNSGDITNIIEYTAATDDMYSKLMQAHTVLDDGDEANFIDSFPMQGRISVFSSEGKNAFLGSAKSVFDTGNSRAVELLEIGSAGGLEPSGINTQVNGYFGSINQTPMHMASSIIFRIADEYIEYGALAEPLKGNLLGMVSAAEATGRGFGLSRATKIVDTRGGQGYELQPLVRWGVSVWYPKGIVLIVKAGYTNPATIAALTVQGKESQIA